MVLNETFIGAGYFEDLSICDELIDFFEKNENLYSPGKSFKGIDPSFKNSLDCSLNRTDLIFQQKYFSELEKVLDLYKQTYIHCDKTCDPWGIVESTNFQKYVPGAGFYGWHSERTVGAIPITYRHLVFMTYLNDVTDGGETEFFYQKIKVQPRKGLTLIWPADWTHTHRGITSPTQTKYIVTGWYSFIPTTQD